MPGSGLQELEQVEMSAVQDLSKVHHLAGGMLKGRQDSGDLERFRVTDEQLAFYRENGYLSGVKIFEPDQADQLLEELNGLFDPKHPGNGLFYEYNSNESKDPAKVLFHALGAWRITPGFHDSLWNPAFTVPASQILEGPVRFWHDQLFCKPAKHGGVVAWHQDYSYWTRTIPMAHLTCWIALEDASVDNGCLHYVPGSHKWDLLPITGLAGNMESIRQVLSPEQAAAFEKAVPIELKKGYGTFHHPLLVHGSFENRTERQRRALVLNAFKDGTRSDSDKELLRGVPPVPAGQKMEGQFFPLLFDPKVGMIQN